VRRLKLLILSFAQSLLTGGQIFVERTMYLRSDFIMEVM